MRNKKYIYLAALLAGVFISMSVQCGGTSSKCLQYSQVNKEQAVAENFQSNNLLFIKYSF